MATPTQNTDGWTLVTRRRRPPHFQSNPQPPPKHTTILNQCALTYAQALQANPHSPPENRNQTPNQPQTTKYARAPHSPTNLRYPPNPHFKEWWGRCFRCAQKGHIVADCKVPRAAPMADHQDQPAAKQTLPEPALKVTNSNRVQQRSRAEPTFEEFLAQPEPTEDPQMPQFRPSKIQCYFNRDEQYFSTLDRVLSGVIIQPPDNLQEELSLDQAAETIAASGKVNPSQLQMARLSKDMVLAVLPPGLNREDVVAKIPNKIWNDGFRFQSYSPLMDAAVSIPFFKVWVDIKGVPLELYTEAHMARAVSSFGIYLGSMEPSVVGDCRTWSIFIATDDLAMLPYQLDLKVGGLVYTAQVVPRKWIKGQVYPHSELPPVSISYRPPSSPQEPAPAMFADPAWFQGDDVFPMSLTALREIFRQFHPSELPSELSACLAGDKRAIEANHAAYRNFERGAHRTALSTQGVPTSPGVATRDPSSIVTLPVASDPLQPTLSPLRPTPLQGTPSTAQHATVHRTSTHASRGKRTQADLALQVCTDISFRVSEQRTNCWEPQVLFPEICTPTKQNNQPVPQCTQVVLECTQGVSHHTQPAPHSLGKDKQTPPQPNRTTLKIKKNRKKKGGEGLLDFDAQAFIDVPLQLAEGREFLAQIGEAHIPIPSNLIFSSQQPATVTETGQTSKAQPKRKKQINELQGDRAHAGHTGPLAMMEGPVVGETSSQDVQCAQVERDEVMTTGPAMVPEPADVHFSTADDQDDDRYLDRVDYSDGEVSL